MKYLWVTAVLAQDGRWRRVPTGDARQFQRRPGPTGTYHFQKDCRARPSTYSPVVTIEDGRLARPSIPTPPGKDWTIGRQGPAVRTGRLGTLMRILKNYNRTTPQSTSGSSISEPPLTKSRMTSKPSEQRFRPKWKCWERGWTVRAMLS